MKGLSRAPKNGNSKFVSVVCIVLFAMLFLNICGGDSCTTWTTIEPSRTAQANNSSANITIEGLMVDVNDFIVISTFLAILNNNETEHSLVDRTELGSFSFEIEVPGWADLDDELYLNITGLDSEKSYASLVFDLNDSRYRVNETFYSIEILIDDPPKNNNKIYILILILALGGIFAGYALFVRWMLLKMVVSRAEKIRIDESEHGGRRDIPP